MIYQRRRAERSWAGRHGRQGGQPSGPSWGRRFWRPFRLICVYERWMERRGVDGGWKMRVERSGRKFPLMDDE